MDNPLIASPGIGVGYPGMDGRIFGDLFLSHHDPLPGIYLPGTISLTVGTVEGKTGRVTLGVVKLLSVIVFAAKTRDIGWP